MPMPASTSVNPELLPYEVAAEIGALFEKAVEENRTSGVSWAIIGGHAHEDRLLAHGAAGHREMTDGKPTASSTPMDRESISRICSMTKSFTAATILALRDEGKLRLDDPVAQYVPEARSITPSSPDAPEITLRHLLTMGAGFVTDNPWGDRQQGMSREDFVKTLAEGLGHVHLPDTRFEYSNTGYALLGRVIDEVTGEDFGAHMRRRILDPLGMTASGFDLDEIDADHVATGHRVADREDATRFEPLPFDPHGVYGAMAGLFCTVDDIARWVRFLAAADAPDSADRDQSILGTASRREMQQMHRHQQTPPLPRGEDGTSPGFDRVRGYGYGLVVEEFPDLGQIVSHSGGYPGYGSFMAWHRDTGVGVVALANSKYAPAVPLSMQALRVLLAKTPQLLAARTATAHPRTLEAAAAALAYLRGDEQAAEEWFADNMDLDVPREERLRRRDAALSAAGLGPEAIAALTVEDAEVITPAQLRWSLPGAEGSEHTVRIDLLMDPRGRSLIQALEVANPRTVSGRNF